MKISYDSLLGHRQRLRERYAQKGFDGLQEHEILEILLFNVEKTKDVQPVAKALLDKFGCISNVLSATQKELEEVKGVGDSLAHSLVFLAEVYRKLSPTSQYPTTLYRAKLIKKAFDVSSHKKYECMTFVAFNRELKLVYSGEVTQHLKNGVDVPATEEIMKKIKSFGGFYVFFSHNHPNGIPSPTPEDFEYTELLVMLCHKYHFAILDHSITAEHGFFSFFYAQEIGNVLTRFFMKNPQEMFYTPARLNHFFFPEPHPKGTMSYHVIGELKLREPIITPDGPFHLLPWSEADYLITNKFDPVQTLDNPYL